MSRYSFPGACCNVRTAILCGLAIIPATASPIMPGGFIGDDMRKPTLEKETNLTLLDEISKIIVGPNIPLIKDEQDLDLAAEVNKVVNPPFVSSVFGLDCDESQNTPALTKREDPTVVEGNSLLSAGDDGHDIHWANNSDISRDEKLSPTDLSNTSDLYTDENIDLVDSSSTSEHMNVLEPRGSNEDTSFSIVNSTPYRWRRGYCHQYQLIPWCDPGGWPDYLEPGKNFYFINGRNGPHKRDGAGEVVYHLEGTSVPMSFMINRTEGGTKESYVRFLENLKTVGNRKGSEFHMGLHDRPAGANFILSGTEGNFYSVGSPDGWMRSIWDSIKYLPLRELVLPRSHHSGLYKVNRMYDFGNYDNTVTQNKNLDYQLSVGGVRVIDLRALSDGVQTYESHGSYVIGKAWSGVVGETLRNMIAQVNYWQDMHPGELIIWDVHPTAYFGNFEIVTKLRKADRLILYEELKLLKHRLSVPDDVDLTEKPLAAFINKGQSGVLIRIDESWLDKGYFPGGKHGFVSGKNFPYNHRWSDTERTEKMTADQIKHINKERSTRDQKIFVSDWLVTQKGAQVLGFGQNIIDMNRAAYSTLYSDLWSAVTDQTYPNWISMDGIHSSELKDISVAMNLCLAARKCGDLGGKVTRNGTAQRWVGADPKHQTMSIWVETFD